MFQESIIASHRQEVFLLKSIGRFLVFFSIRLPNYVRTQKSPGTVAEAPGKRQRQLRNGTTQIDKLIEASERQPSIVLKITKQGAYVTGVLNKAGS